MSSNHMEKEYKDCEFIAEWMKVSSTIFTGVPPQQMGIMNKL